MLSEIGKATIGLIITCLDTNRQKSVYTLVFSDTLFIGKMSIPAILYGIQNLLLYTALGHLEASVYQITYQIKTFTTAVFAMIILNRIFDSMQWLSFFLLFIGAISANLSVIDNDNNNNDVKQFDMIGVICVCCAAITSGIVGNYLEKIFKNDKSRSIYVKNIHLGIFGCIAAFICSLFTNEFNDIIYPYGFFQGFTNITWIVVILNMCSGYIVAFVIYWTSNIIKAFAAEVSIILIIIGSWNWMFFDAQITKLFIFGAMCVLCGNALYTRQKMKQTQNRILKILIN